MRNSFSLSLRLLSFVSFLLIVLSFSLYPCLGQVPGILSCQGRVTVSGTNFDGTGQFKFALVDGGNILARRATAVADREGHTWVSSIHLIPLKKSASTL